MTPRPLAEGDREMVALKPVKDGEWIQPRMRGYLLGCCDCGLRHRMNFRLYGGHIQFQAFRLSRKRRKL